MVICDECGCEDIYTDHERGELICTNCGLVIDQQLVLRQEVAYPEQDILHYHPIADSHTITESRTIIGNDVTDSAGKKLDSHKIFKLKKTMHYGKSPIIKRAERLIKVIESQLDLSPDIKQRVRYWFKKMRNETSGKSVEVLVTSSFIIATRFLKIPLPFTDLAKFTKLSAKRIKTGYVRLIQELNLSVPILRPHNFVPSFCEKLGVNGETSQLVLNFLKSHNDTSGKSPKLIAAALIYHFAKPQLTQLQVCNICKVTDVAIRNTLHNFDLMPKSR